MGPKLQIRAKVFRNARLSSTAEPFSTPRLGVITRATMLMSLMLALAVGLWAQQPASQNTLGVVTNIDAATSQLTLKTDAGQEIKVSMAPNASFRRVAPGETDLRNATNIAVTDIAAGDRVLAVGKIGDDKSVTARLVVVMSKADIANKQSNEMADWTKRGVLGIVASTGNGEIALNVRGPGGNKTLVITPASDAVIRRYTGDSIKFQEAKPSTLAEIKVGDQVRARGDKTADGAKMTAEEIVSGSFKEIAATIISVDPVEKVMRVNDLATKKPVIVKIDKDSNLRKLPPQMAQMLAAQAHPPEAGGRGGPPPQDGGGRNGPGGPGAGRGRGGDPAQLLERSQTMTLADLKNGDAIIILGTVSANDQLNVITMLAGVEPILTKPGTREMSLGGWSLGGGMGEGGQ
jgi:hypothetical protein